MLEYKMKDVSKIQAISLLFLMSILGVTFLGFAYSEKQDLGDAQDACTRACNTQGALAEIRHGECWCIYKLGDNHEW